MTPTTPNPPRLLDQLRTACRLRHFSRRTEDTYCQWARRYILHHGKRHPTELGAKDVTAFLASLAEDRQVSAATQNQALCALLFLYRAVLDRPLPRHIDLPRARTSPYMPVVLTRAEVRAVLAQLSGVPGLVASLLYGSGLRLLECLERRVRTSTSRNARSSSDRARVARTASPCCCLVT